MKKIVARFGIDTVIVGGAGLAGLLLTANPMIVLIACVLANYFSAAIQAKLPRGWK